MAAAKKKKVYGPPAPKTVVAADKAKQDLGKVPRTESGAVDITSLVQYVTPNVQDIGKQIESLFSGPGMSGGYRPTMIDQNEIAGLYQQNPLVTTGGLQKQLAAERASALESQLAALDVSYRDSLGQVESAYGAVNQLLGAAQQDFTKGYNPIVASQAGVNAETAAAMQQAQQEVAARLASTGSTSVGGGQSAAVGTQVAAEAAATGAAQSDLLIGQGGAMQAYMTGMAPQLASLARAGAIQGLGSARVNAEAKARADAAQARLEDMRALALQDIQMQNQRAGDIIGAMSNVISTNTSARNQAAASNASAAQQLAIAKANLKASIWEEERKSAKGLGAALYGVLDPLDKKVTRFVNESGGRGAEAIFNEAPDGTALSPTERLMNPDGSINYDNYQAWSRATNRDESYLMTYLAAKRALGQANESDFQAAVDSTAKVKALELVGMKGDDIPQPTDAAKYTRFNQAFDMFRKEYVKQYASFAQSTDPEHGVQVDAATNAYLRMAMASAFRPYVPSGTTPQASPGGSFLPSAAEALMLGRRYPAFAPLTTVYAGGRAAFNAGRNM